MNAAIVKKDIQFGACELTVISNHIDSESLPPEFTIISGELVTENSANDHAILDVAGDLFVGRLELVDKKMGRYEPLNQRNRSCQNETEKRAKPVKIDLAA